MNISKNTGIRISLEKPLFDMMNLLGTVLKDSGNKILIEINDNHKLKLNNNYIYGNRFILISDNNETTRSLSQYYSLSVEIYFIDDKTGVEILVGRGNATID
ncbi:MAG: hypothetical protein BM557_08755 [Flavobacterium sp. MedPE-SWcel]|uniref:hypothetical protein n=1 Tax=uncultured Flavobacterium sp. TaxID=165435 RepID=UPI00091FB5E5|nr:hypothetical protein [uncultured Flavobacterium sp.]OIQ17292.1 MAG: hypothetical protein BM557_08755 [Flavobacterium sp. MedPE-SWcel]